MKNNIIPAIKEIFVGRRSELQQLEALWKVASLSEEHFVYVLLNAPGVGKTTLINFFGASLETNAKGLYVRFVCDSSYDSTLKINSEILNTIYKTIKNKDQIIEKYLSSKKNVNLKEERENLLNLKKEITDVSKNNEIDLYKIKKIIDKLSEIIPVFLAADEIQEFQKINLKDSKDFSVEESALHYYSRILKSLLNSKILLIISGTRYHILSQIGESIGSPIRQKVKPIIIRNFVSNEIDEYVNQVRIILDQLIQKENKQNISFYINNFRLFLLAFSGGHPRTIENITELLLNAFPLLISDIQFQDYKRFLEFLLPKTEELFSNSLLSTIHKEALSKLSANGAFSIIKSWILKSGSNGQFLGERPKLNDNAALDDEIKRIVYELMNIGIIVQNGNYYYHLTSYFHFLEFLKVFNDFYENFLKQVLTNKFFTLMCSRHSGLGYIFENIFSSALLIYGKKEQDSISLPLQVSQLKSLEVLKGEIDWKKLSFEQNRLYQTPEAKSVDGFILQGSALILLQITTAENPDTSKIDDLKKEMDRIQKLKTTERKISNIKGWIVSLYEFIKKIPIYEKIVVTAGENLVPLLGKQLFKKLKEIKQNL